MATYSMTREERETFLAEVHVAVLSLSEEGRGPLTVPIWYGYEPGGEVWFVTEKTSKKASLLDEGTRISLCVQTEVAPYKYVSIEGPVTSVQPADVERHTRPLAHRYLGVDRGDRYIESTGGEEARGASIRVCVRPERWLTVDYGKA